MSLELSQSFSFFGGGGWFDDKKSSSSNKAELSPSFRIQTDKEVYRPGDLISATIEISNPRISEETNETESFSHESCSLLVDNLAFEVKGIEKLDSQWISIQKPLPGSKQRRGETVFLDCRAPTIVSKVIVSCGRTKTYMIRAELPKILPPSYRGTSIRYLYYVRSTISGRWLVLDNGHHDKHSVNDLIQLEARAPLQVWASSQKSSNFLNNEGALFFNSVQMDIYWKEKDADSGWVQANEFSDEFEEGYDSSRDEVSSVSSFTPARGNIDLSIRKSLSSQSISARVSSNEYQYAHGERSGHPSYMPLPRFSVAEDIDNPEERMMSPHKELDRSSSLYLHQRNLSSSFVSRGDVALPFATGYAEPLPSEGSSREKSYNIRIDDQILLRFAPKNSDSTYYFGDMIGGTLTFFHREGPRRCLEVSITLEISEVINQQYVHRSRRNAPTITKVQSDHHEVVADLVQTSFIFSIPCDGPMSFSNPYVSIQWSLRFEFFTTPMHVDLNRYDHPLLVEEREKGDWVLPITVYAPPLGAQAPHTRNDEAFSLGSLFPA